MHSEVILHRHVLYLWHNQLTSHCLEQCFIDLNALGDLTTKKFSDKIVFNDTLKTLVIITYEP